MSVSFALLEMRCVGHECVQRLQMVLSFFLLTSFHQNSKMSEVEKAFCKFAVYGDTSASGNDMTGKNFSKMCKECGVMDGKAVTSTDVDIVFNKVK